MAKIIDPTHQQKQVSPADNVVQDQVVITFQVVRGEMIVKIFAQNYETNLFKFAKKVMDQVPKLINEEATKVQPATQMPQAPGGP